MSSLTKGALGPGVFVAILGCISGCNSEKAGESATPALVPPSTEDPETRAVQDKMKALIAERIDAWLEASRELQQAAPEPEGRGWGAKLDAAAIEAMKRHWLTGRDAYELIEGAIASIFPESDTATDARYDDFLGVIGGTGDHHPFDDQGIVGMHAIERILWADSIPEEVVRFEQGVPGYKAAAQPATEEEARLFKNALAKRLVTDIETLKRQFATVELDIAFAFRGLIDLAVEQAEKVDLAATGQEESRYAQTTMRDLRANYRGCVDAYAIFKPWLLAKPGGEEADRAVTAAFDRLQAAYAKVSGDAIPRPPRTWSSLEPSEADRASEFGSLFVAVSDETADTKEGSLHHSLIRVADALGLPKRVAR